jgi:hypothetical protein
MDETPVNWFPPLARCWMKRGDQRRVSVPPDTHHRRVVFGGYNWTRDTVCSLVREKADTASCLAFLELLLADTCPDQPVVLILDNASYHHAAAVQAFLSLVEHRVLVFYLPPYCSHLNPIERFWRFLKDQVCANTLYPDLDALMSAVDHLLTQQNDPSCSSRFLLSKGEP